MSAGCAELAKTLFCKFPRQLLLAISQVRLGEAFIDIGGIGISEKVQLEDSYCVFEIAGALIILGDDTHRDFGPKLGTRIFLACLDQLLLCAGCVIVELDVGQQWRCRQSVCRSVTGRLESGYKPMHDDARQLGMNLEHVSTVAPFGRDLANVKWLIPQPRRLFCCGVVDELFARA